MTTRLFYRQKQHTKVVTDASGKAQIIFVGNEKQHEAFVPSNEVEIMIAAMFASGWEEQKMC